MKLFSPFSKYILHIYMNEIITVGLPLILIFLHPTYTLTNSHPLTICIWNYDISYVFCLYFLLFKQYIHTPIYYINLHKIFCIGLCKQVFIQEWLYSQKFTHKTYLSLYIHTQISKFIPLKNFIEIFRIHFTLINHIITSYYSFSSYKSHD